MTEEHRSDMSKQPGKDPYSTIRLINLVYGICKRLNTEN